MLVDKPKGWTSHDVVAKVRGILQKNPPAGGGKKVKVGHTGTLDPLATGLLVLLVGSYTKRASEFSKLDKTYEVLMKLGETSTTGDEEGIKTVVSSSQIVDREEVEETLKQFVGENMQVPPAFSAVKVDGKRAYKLAREGKEFVLEPRKVTIHDVKNIEYAYPKVKFTVEVSSGTYIRSLVQDIGKKLDTGAYMSNLRRTKVGEYELDEAISPNDVTEAGTFSSQ